MDDLRDRGDNDSRSYEAESKYARSGPTTFGRNPCTIGQNIPAYYKDTPVNYEGADPDISAGSYQSRLLSPGVWYYYEIGNDRSGPIGCAPRATYPIKVGAQRSLHRGSCAFGYEWCVYAKDGWPTDVVPFSADLTSDRPPYAWDYNLLFNESFEADPNSYWSLLRPAGGNAQWAGYVGGAYEDSSFLEFNCAGTVPGCAVRQNVGFHMSDVDKYTAELAVRCNSTSGCPISVEIVASDFGVGSGDLGSMDYGVPADGQWYIVVLSVSGFTPRDQIGISLVNRSASRNVDVDFATLRWTDLCSTSPCR